MTNPYREGSTPAGELECPRCGKPLPPLDIAACPDECGTWVSAQASTVTFDPDEVRENLVTRWWRVRAPCPICAEQMTLRGVLDVHFQGCDRHGFWVDADTISQTGLVRPDLRERIKRMHEDVEAQRAEIERRARAKANDQREREREEEQARLAAAQRHAVRERQRSAAMRASIEENVARALASGKATSIVDEIVRLQEMIVDLAERLTDVEKKLSKR